jgi:TPR repeat protein
MPNGYYGSCITYFPEAGVPKPNGFWTPHRRVEGIVYLGKGYCTGIGLPWDFAKALELFKQAADRDDIEDLCEYAYMPIYALEVNRDWVQATALYKRAADGGHGLAQ